MVSIKLEFRESDDGAGFLFYRVSMDRQSVAIESGLCIMARDWIARRRCVSPQCPYARRVAAELARISFIVKKMVAENVDFGVDDIVARFERYNREYTVEALFDKAIERHIKSGRLRTAETYRATRNCFARFSGAENPAIDLVDSEMISDFEAYLRGRGLLLNTTSFYMRVFRALYNRAAADGILEQRMPFAQVYTGVDKTVKRALPASAIRRIQALDLGSNPRAAYARDMFMMSFYLRGMSMIDMAFLRKSDLRCGTVCYRRRKTGQLLTIKWLPEMQRIIERYGPNPTRFLLPIIRSTAENERCAYRNAAYRINRELRRVADMAGVKGPLTLYVARHSWASVARATGIPLSVISEGMGHDSEQTTRIYLASLDASVIDRANARILRAVSR